ncbi:SAP30-binding protein-like isoform X2 [Gigantopelta aegis]|uniref:SAP30-binding protein-like isoform X2 n=1 Tax=Gigantopelta aegis TaxID=1735272 RepID=UPI001B889CD3|nr:SAP30-binding protein-like isoform X2 [Gigantopelta aegis]
MDRTDSSAAMSALRSDYGDSDEETSLTVDNISDEENAVVSVKHQPPSVQSFQDDSSNHSSASGVNAAKETKNTKVAKRVTKLVSYGPDDQDEDHVETDEDEDEENKDVEQHVGALDAQDASALSRSVRNKSLDEIEIPPEPPGKCSPAVQEKILKNYEKMKKGNLNLNISIQRRKDFRNPSIYEKLIEYCQIDEKGTNFPPDIFDPHMWTKESFYDELDKAQKKEMEKREKERKERTKKRRDENPNGMPCPTHPLLT